MPDNINYVKEVLKSDINLGFVGIMVFLMLVFNFWGFLPFLMAGEIAALFIAQNSRVQLLIRSRLNKNKIIETQEAETQILRSLPVEYQTDFDSVVHLCGEIERRTLELDGSRSNVLLTGLVEKLSSFRYDYARMLRARHLLSSKNYKNLQTVLGSQIARAEEAAQKETSPQVRQALTQNLNVLMQRLDRIKKLDELVRLLEARLQVIKNSLSLIQDEVYTFTDVSSISGLVDNLLVNLKISDDFRSAYHEVLNVEYSPNGVTQFESSLGVTEAANPDAPNDDSESRSRLPRERLRRTK